jgi:hypothetical protein
VGGKVLVEGVGSTTGGTTGGAVGAFVGDGVIMDSGVGRLEEGSMWNFGKNVSLVRVVEDIRNQLNMSW